MAAEAGARECCSTTRHDGSDRRAFRRPAPVSTQRDARLRSPRDSDATEKGSAMGNGNEEVNVVNVEIDPRRKGENR